MTLYIDIENKKLVQSLTSDRSVSLPVFMQGDNEPLELHLLEKGDETLYKEKTLVVGTDFLRVAIARFKGTPNVLTYATDYTLNANGGSEIVLPLNTTAIEQAVEDDEYISAFLEVEYSNIDGKIVTILQTACRLKNDLVENAPSIELQEQFYNKVYTDEIFSKKSANLSDLSDKAESRTNLDVYSKGEIDSQDALNLKKANNLSDVSNKATARTNLDVYSKGEVDSQERLNLKKANNLLDVSNKATARTNLEVYSKSEIDSKDVKNLKRESNLSDVSDVEQARLNLDVPRTQTLALYGMSGIYSDNGLCSLGAHDTAIASDFTSGNASTFLTTYLGGGDDFYLYNSYYGDYSAFAPRITNNGSAISLGYMDDYDAETGEYITNTFAHNLSSPIEFGDKVALIVKEDNFYLYKNIELVASGEIPSGLNRYEPTNVLVWEGLKKDLLYSISIALPITKAEAKTSSFPYSIEQFVNGEYPPLKLLNSRFKEQQFIFSSDYIAGNTYLKAEGGYDFGGRNGALKLSIKPNQYARERTYNLGTRYLDTGGIEYTISFYIYIPTSNPNVKKTQLRIGGTAPLSAGVIVSKTNNIDDKGYILAKDEWQNVQVVIRSTKGSMGRPTLYLYKDSSASYKIETETTDAVYLRDIVISCSQGIECFFYGAARGGAWKNMGASNIDIFNSEGYSFPCEVSDEYVYRQPVSNFSYGTSLYLENTPKDWELSKIIVNFDADIPDTSGADLDDYQKNIFTFSINNESSYLFSEHLPEIPVNRAYIIYPKTINREPIISVTIDSMYSINCGGTIDFVFRKAR